MLLKRKRLTLEQQDYIAGYVFVLPILIMMSIWFYFPAVKSLIFSFQEVNFFSLNHPTFIGLNNFKELFRDPNFIQATGNTIFITVISVPVLLISGFLIAYNIENIVSGRALYRTLFFIPAVTSAVALTMALMYLFVSGAFIPVLLNRLFGIPDVTWPADPRTALAFVAILVIWKNLGIFVVLYINALNTIPKEIFEAAELDGAKGLKKLRFITIPLVKPTTVLSLLLCVTWCMQTFDEPFTLARSGNVVGSPAGTTSTLITFFYSQNFRFFRPGYASSAAFFLFLILLLFSLGQNAIEKRQERRDT
ncbi:carbohydrate ABC transporter permease [Sediminispirochaeta bajacaliforniensis]|uniref:carbohydrate ABC transporter permease n=1 Tax=Sediminispirochaeta bajacaliforniensis TaxID=148 RepID=UPI00035F5F94|nr:sugar ABC transporter permease [Sediminispirochaeta bajacaliforniensis]